MMKKKEVVLSMHDIKKSFGKQDALKDLSFEVMEGEIFGFLGPSGAGKTTTVKLFTAQLMPSQGQVRVLGQDVFSHKHELFKHMGVLTDTSGLYERLSLMENLMLFARIHGVSKAHVLEIVEGVGLTEHLKKPISKLSKGMRQRVMIASAVLHTPKILFLDEPTASLDPGTTLEIHKLIRGLNATGTTIFLTTHDMMEADKLCGRVAFLHEGKIVDMGAPEALKVKYANDSIAGTLMDGTAFSLKKDGTSADQLSVWLHSNQLRTIHSNEPNLEHIFLSLTGKELA